MFDNFWPQDVHAFSSIFLFEVFFLTRQGKSFIYFYSCPASTFLCLLWWECREVWAGRVCGIGIWCWCLVSHCGLRMYLYFLCLSFELFFSWYARENPSSSIFAPIPLVRFCLFCGGSVSRESVWYWDLMLMPGSVTGSWVWCPLMSVSVSSPLRDRQAHCRHL